jgi:hypothetical protein
MSDVVQLTKERKEHIAQNHPDLFPKYEDRIASVLNDPDQVRISERFKNAHLFSKWFDNIRAGKYIVVVVISEHGPVNRNWIVTAYITRRLSGGRLDEFVKSPRNH